MELAGRVATGLRAVLCRVELVGAEHLPRRGPAIVAVNHTTIVDVVPVLASLRAAGLRPSPPCGRAGCGERSADGSGHAHIRFLATELLVRHPAGGPLARAAGVIEVAHRRPAPEALRAAAAALARGEILGIYPEGDVSATPDGAPRPWRSGTARLALEARCPVVPLAHHDAREIASGSYGESLRRLPVTMRRRPLVRLHVGTPVTPQELAGLDVAAATALLRDRLTDVWREAAAARG